MLDQKLIDDLKREFGGGIAEINARLAEATRLTKEAEERAVKAEERAVKMHAGLEELSERVARKEKLERDIDVRVNVNGEIRSRVSEGTANELVRVFTGSQKRVLNSAVDADGGFLIAPEFAAEIIRLIPEVGLYRRVARAIPMASDEKNFGSLASGITVSWPGENTNIPPSNPTFGQLKLVAKILAGYVEAPESLLDDASPELGQFLAELFIEGLALEEDRVGFVGSTVASDPFNGILFAPNVVAKVMDAGGTTFSQVTADYLLDLQTAVPDGARNGAAYFLSPTVFDKVRKIKDTTGDYIWQRPVDGAPGTIWGKPYHLTERMPALSATAVSKAFVAYGNPRFMILGDRKAIAVKATDVGGGVFQKIATALRVHERIAVNSYGGAFAKLVTAAV